HRRHGGAEGERELARLVGQLRGAERLEGADEPALHGEGKEKRVSSLAGDALPPRLAPDAFVEERSRVPSLLGRGPECIERTAPPDVPDRPPLFLVAQLQARRIP